jgi:hypothetical protein
MKKIVFLLLVSIFFACQSDPEVQPDERPFTVLILGNSITHHYPAPELGWYGSWGMAATAPELDFVSILGDSIKRRFPLADIQTRTMVDFEREYWNYDFGKMADVGQDVVDVLIWRLAENVPKENFDPEVFQTQVEKVINLMKSHNPEMKVLITNSFWGYDEISESLAAVAESNQWVLVDIAPLAYEAKYRAYDDFENPSVAIHPGDKGMHAIATLIWEDFRKLF